ncbi:MAG: YihY/virulence factor BrkB family protein [Xanthobacteraceae bacterium]|nr:YihY/virulence factor BrkB family protein [Xanthobacteraceae bacterium]
MGRLYRIAIDAFDRFNDDDGWAIASHIALSALMALFPFLIVVTALGAVFGSKELADETARILLETWPKEVADPIAREIHDVLTNLRTEALTVGALFAIIFASSGVESLRIGLNRAYGMKEERSWWLLRLESIAYVLIGAAASLALSFLVVLWPLIWVTAIKYLRWLEPLDYLVDFARLSAAAAVLIVALLVVHLWLPAGRRSLTEVVPGIVVTLVLWIAGGTLFGRYLAEFAFAYTIYYAGLASAVAALFFLYLVALIFIYGGELNAAIRRSRGRRG